MKRLFLDANVLFTAAHNPDGKAALIISFGEAGILHLCTSAFAAEEARRNLSAKFPNTLKQFSKILQTAAIVPERPDALFPPDLIEKDRPIFQAALACKATHLITGDIAHFGSFMRRPAKTFGIIILTPAQFLDSF
ncbi:MAG: PIN domain-containing protein [Nitrospirae bacterium]|nr:PIN domain-containing protein [Nitrospirota bacterium]